MHLAHLSYLIEISKNPSLTSASENLFITPQALSTAIKTLENELGVTLLTRSNKGIRLTTHGETICRLAAEIMKNVDEINRYCLKNSVHSNIKGTLSIASSPTGASFFLPKILLNFTAKYQNITILTAECSTAAIMEGILAKRYDIGLINANYEFLTTACKALTDQLDFYEILTGKLSILCSKHSPIYAMKNVAWAKACAYPMLITITDNVDAFNIYGLGNEKLLPQKLYNYSNALLCIETIAQTDFIGVAIDTGLKYIPDSIRPDIRAVPLKENITNGFYLVTPKASDAAPAISAFLELITNS